MIELKVWQVSEPHEGAKEFRAPSTNGKVTARAGGIRIEGNVTNITGDEHDEFPEVLREALAHHDAKKAARIARRASVETSTAPVVADAPSTTPVSVPSGRQRSSTSDVTGSQGN